MKELFSAGRLAWFSALCLCLLAAPVAPAAEKKADEQAPAESAILGESELSPDEKGLAATLKKKYPTTVDDLRAIEKRVTSVIDRISKATVGVVIGASQGSGVIISEDGYVLTAGHVSGKPNQKVKFVLHDGTVVDGKTLGLNRGIDSGLMKITTKRKWDYVEMAESGATAAGQWCIAVGHPGGYERGRRPVVRLGRILFNNKKVICTDCTLVGGDSGGPLFDFDGRVIGIHSRIGWQITTNFHVPIATYHDTWDRLVAGEMWGGRLAGAVSAGRRPLLGISGDPDDGPCRVAQVFPGSPAQKAGLKTGDVIQQFDGKVVANFRALAEMVAKHKPGDKVKVELQRDDEKLSLELELGAMRGRLPGGLPDEKSEEDEDDDE